MIRSLCACIIALYRRIFRRGVKTSYVRYDDAKARIERAERRLEEVRLARMKAEIMSQQRVPDDQRNR